MKVVFNGAVLELRYVDGRGVPLPVMTSFGTQTDISGPIMAVGTGVNIATSPMVPVVTVDMVDIDESIFNRAMDAMANWQPHTSGPLDTGVLEEPQTEETVATGTDEAPTDLTRTVI